MININDNNLINYQISHGILSGIKKKKLIN